MVDLTSPEARERIARAICCHGRTCCNSDGRPYVVCQAHTFMEDADAALAEVAAMLKEE